MYDGEVLLEKLRTLLEALERIPRRFAGIAAPADFHGSDAGVDRMDAICMILIAVGEEFKNIDRKTEGLLLKRYPEVKWRGLTGMRDVLTHGYFRVDAEQLFDICANHIPALIATVKTMIGDVEHGRALQTHDPE
ncbi:MAG: HepT-like ribonuclease domain-containing protein [Pseudomonadota bacterium]